MHICSVNSWQTSQEYATVKGESLWQMVFRKLDSHKQNKKMGSPGFTC